MRVLVVSAWETWREGDGSCLVLREQLRELAGRPDLDLELLCAGAPGREASPPAGSVPVPARWFGRALPAAPDALVRRLRARAGGEPAHVHYVGRPALRRAFRERLATSPPDVVHLFGWGTAGLQRQLGDVPAVHDAVDPWSANLANRRLPGWQRALDASQARRVRAHEARHYPRLAAVVVRTPQDAALLQAQVPAATVRVVPNGVRPGPEPRYPDRAAVLGYLGAYDAQSNIVAATRLVRGVLPLVRAGLPGTTALLIGRDPPGGLRALGAELTGTVPDVRPHLDRLGVLVVPLTCGVGVRNKVLEAMAAGVPVVGTALALHGVDPGAGVVTAETDAALAEAALRWLRDPALRRAAGEDNRRRAVRDLSWAASADRVQQLWREVAG